MDALKRLLCIGFVALILLSAGCLCCKLPGKSTSTTVRTTRATTAATLAGCSPPNIKHGSGCCLDANGNGVCDKDESSMSTLVSTSHGTLATTEATTRATTIITVATTTVTAATTTTRAPNPKAECVKRYGVTPGTVLYLYTHKCCDAVLTPMVDRVEAKGYTFRHIDMAYPSDKDKALIYCFYSSLPDIVPELICTADGDSLLIVGYENPQSAINTFASNCQQAAS